MNVMQKKAIYDEMSALLTRFDELEPGGTSLDDDVNVWAADAYDIMVKIKNALDELFSPADGYKEDGICWKKYKEGDKKYLSIKERMTLPSKKYGGYYIGFPEGDSKNQEEWYIPIPDLLKLPRCEKG